MQAYPRESWQMRIHDPAPYLYVTCALEEKFGAFRTIDMILAEYDAMLEGMRAGE